MGKDRAYGSGDILRQTDRHAHADMLITILRKYGGHFWPTLYSTHGSPTAEAGRSKASPHPWVMASVMLMHCKQKMYEFSTNANSNRSGLSS